ncbi:MAG: hypothetical protein IT477_10520 [Rhodanobacteraceae bacterium]|nr:hypothetical protein [Rhodanobacteraceae bacterium]
MAMTQSQAQADYDALLLEAGDPTTPAERLDEILSLGPLALPDHPLWLALGKEAQHRLRDVALLNPMVSRKRLEGFLWTMPQAAMNPSLDLYLLEDPGLFVVLASAENTRLVDALQQSGWSPDALGATLLRLLESMEQAGVKHPTASVQRRFYQRLIEKGTKEPFLGAQYGRFKNEQMGLYERAHPEFDRWAKAVEYLRQEPEAATTFVDLVWAMLDFDTPEDATEFDTYRATGRVAQILHDLSGGAHPPALKPDFL